MINHDLHKPKSHPSNFSLKVEFVVMCITQSFISFSIELIQQLRIVLNKKLMNSNKDFKPGNEMLNHYIYVDQTNNKQTPI